MAMVNINDNYKEYYYKQFVRDFYTMPRIITDACGDYLLLPLLFKQIRHNYEFVLHDGGVCELNSNEMVVAQMNARGLKKLLLPELRFYNDDKVDYVLSSNWMSELASISLPNLENSADGFLRYTFGLNEIFAPKWHTAGNFTLFVKKGILSVLDAPCLRRAGTHCHPMIYETIRKNRGKNK